MTSFFRPLAQQRPLLPLTHNPHEPRAVTSDIVLEMQPVGPTNRLNRNPALEASAAEKMPKELWTMIAKKLDPKSLAQLADSSHFLREVATDPLLWQAFAQTYGALPLLADKRQIKRSKPKDTEDLAARLTAKQQNRRNWVGGGLLSMAWMIADLVMTYKLNPNPVLGPAPQAPESPAGFNGTDCVTASDCAAEQCVGYGVISDYWDDEYCQTVPPSDPGSYNITASNQTLNSNCEVNYYPDPSYDWCRVPVASWPPTSTFNTTAASDCFNSIASCNIAVPTYLTAVAQFHNESIAYNASNAGAIAHHDNGIQAGHNALVGMAVMLALPSVVFHAWRFGKQAYDNRARAPAPDSEGTSRKQIMLQYGVAEQLRAPLHESISEGDIKRLKRILKQAPVANLPNAEMRMPAERAVLLNDPVALRVLIDAGAHAVQNWLLDQAVLGPDTHSVVEILLEQGLRPTGEHLRVAVQRGDYALASMLFAACTSPEQRRTLANTRSPRGPVLLDAVRLEQTDLIPLLLENGAGPNDGDFDKNMPLHLAVTARDIRSVRLLIEAGADIHLRNNYNVSPWHLAQMRPEVFATLLDEAAVSV